MTDTQTDIAIIGGGIAAGARLAPHARVAALEAKAAIGYHARNRSVLYKLSHGMTSAMALGRARPSPKDFSA